MPYFSLIATIIVVVNGATATASDATTPVLATTLAHNIIGNKVVVGSFVAGGALVILAGTATVISVSLVHALQPHGACQPHMSCSFAAPA